MKTIGEYEIEINYKVDILGGIMTIYKLVGSERSFVMVVEFRRGRPEEVIFYDGSGVWRSNLQSALKEVRKQKRARAERHNGMLDYGSIDFLNHYLDL